MTIDEADSHPLRRLTRLQRVYGLVATVLIVAAGDLVYPWLDRRIGLVASDLVEAIVISAILYLITRPQMRELRRSIIELDELRRCFYAESIHDGLTGLFNRRHFDDRLSEEFERSRRYGQTMSVCVIDVDRFKQINDQHGHAAGDAVLIELARRFEGRRRRGDILARIGGEEFAVILPNLGLENARAFAEELRRLIESEPFLIGPRATLITVSCGVAELRSGDNFGFDILRRADEALYEAKKTRNAVAVAR
jgi:diguanylate cyclase (GGDEF)-like protein